jgi:hypothetical protein
MLRFFYQDEEVESEFIEVVNKKAS